MNEFYCNKCDNFYIKIADNFICECGEVLFPRKEEENGYKTG